MSDQFPTGFAIELQGQRYCPVHTDGNRVMWRTDCPSCGQTFDLWTGLVFSYPVRRCDDCKSPGKPVRRAELTRSCSGIDAAQDRPRDRLASIHANLRVGMVELTQQSPPVPQSAGPKLGINAGIDALIDAAAVSRVGVGR